MTVKITIDKETGELIRENIMVAVENAPRIIIDINDVKIYHNDPDKLVDKIREQAGFAVFDVSTEKGRAACRSHAANIIKCIAPALNASKALASEAKKVVNQDLNFRNYFESAVREIAAYHRLPLTEYEAEQERIKNEQLAREAKRLAYENYLVDWDDALDLDELYMLRKAKAEQERLHAEAQRQKDERAAFEKAVAERVEAERKLADEYVHDSSIVERVPTRNEIIKVIAREFGATQEKAAYWLICEFGDI